jgi:hypothetical protein
MRGRATSIWSRRASFADRLILALRIARTAWSIYTYNTEFDPARLTSPVLRVH